MVALGDVLPFAALGLLAGGVEAVAGHWGLLDADGGGLGWFGDGLGDEILFHLEFEDVLGLVLVLRLGLGLVLRDSFQDVAFLGHLRD